MVNINKQNAKQKAQEFANLSSELEAEITNLKNLLASVRGNWQGPASDAYQRQLSSLIARLESTKHSISVLSNDIQRLANS